MVSGVGMGQLSEAGVVGWLVLSTGHGDGLTLQEGELLDVVDEADLGSGPIQSDGADEPRISQMDRDPVRMVC